MEPQRPLEAPPYLVPHSSESIRIHYADQSLLIVDKPHLLLSVPGRHPLNRDSLISRLQRQFPGVTAAHRLDLDTSGLLVVPRNKTALAHLNRQFQGRNIQKTYQALVHGAVAEEEGEISLPLSADWENRPKQKICERSGKPSQTKFKVLGRDCDRTLVELRPITGRSHQLRVHMMALGHPILGCDMYAHPEALAAAPRLLLHARDLSFQHPNTGDWLRAHSPAPFGLSGLTGVRPG